MLANEARIARRGRLLPADLECLEGRRLMAAAVAQVSIQETAESGTPTLLISGTNRADVINVVDNGTAAPGNITVTYGNGATYTSTTAVTQVAVLGKGGNDQVTYTLSGPLTAARAVVADLGAGNDQFLANINGDINVAGGELDLESYGETGNDVMTVNQSGAVLAGSFVPYLEGDAGNDTITYNGTSNVSAGGVLTPELSGGAGNDTINENETGQINGNYLYNLTIDGGAGNDRIVDNVNVAAGSAGTIGTSSATPAAIEGSAGNDTIRFAVNVDPSATAQVNAVTVGGAGKDTVQETSNVLSDKSDEKVGLPS